MDKHLLYPLQIIIKTQSAQRRIRKLPIGRGEGQRPVEKYWVIWTGGCRRSDMQSGRYPYFSISINPL